MFRSGCGVTTYDKLQGIGPRSSDAYEVLDNDAGRQVHIVKSARVVLRLKPAKLAEKDCGMGPGKKGGGLTAAPMKTGHRVLAAGSVAETCGRKVCSRANGLEVNPRGQGLRGYGSAAHGLPACESRDAGRAPPLRFRLHEPARPAGRSRAAPGSTSS